MSEINSTKDLSNPDPTRVPIAWKCTADGIHWVKSKERQCIYCLPVYEEE